MRRYNESKIHNSQKERIGQILREEGWEVWVDEYEFKIPQREHGYWPDVYAEKGSRRVILEIQGPGGHHSKTAAALGSMRIRTIREHHGRNIEQYCFYINRRKGPMDVRTWEKSDILEHCNCH